METRDVSAGALEQRLRLNRVELGGGAILKAGFGDLQRLFLEIDVRLCLSNERLVSSNRDIGSSDFGGQCDDIEIVVCDG